MLSVIGASGATFFTCVLAILVFRPLATAIDLVDRPGGRKTHHGEIPIVGGLSMFLALCVGFGLAPAVGLIGSTFLGAGVLLLVIGLLDDRFNLSPWMRLPVHAAAAALMISGSGVMITSLGAPFGSAEIELGNWMGAVLTVLITIAAINAFNMLDGMDGLAGAVAIIAFAALSYLSWWNASPTLWIVGAIYIAAIAGFLVFNLPISSNRRVRCFMGDGGSTVLGFGVVWFGILVLNRAPAEKFAPVTLLWFVALPVYELVSSTLRRLAKGQSPLAADSEHFHHMLLRAGFGIRAAFAVFVAGSLVFAGVGLVFHSLRIPEPVSLASFVAGGVLTFQFMRSASLFLPLLPRAWHRPYEQVSPTSRIRPRF